MVLPGCLLVEDAGAQALRGWHALLDVLFFRVISALGEVKGGDCSDRIGLLLQRTCVPRLGGLLLQVLDRLQHHVSAETVEHSPEFLIVASLY